MPTHMFYTSFLIKVLAEKKHRSFSICYEQISGMACKSTELMQVTFIHLQATEADIWCNVT